MFPVLCFARTGRNKIVRYILELYTSHKAPNTTLNPVAKNRWRWFVRFPPTCHSRANPTVFTTANVRPCATLFTAGMPCSAQGLSHWKSGYPCPTVPYPFATFQCDDIVVFVSLFYKRPNAVHDEGQGGRRIACPPHVSCSMHIHLPVLELEISLTSVQARTVRNSVMRPQKLGKRWMRRRKEQENELTGCARSTCGNGCCRSRCDNTVGHSTANWWRDVFFLLLVLWTTIRPWGWGGR